MARHCLRRWEVMAHYMISTGPKTGIARAFIATIHYIFNFSVLLWIIYFSFAFLDTGSGRDDDSKGTCREPVRHMLLRYLPTKNAHEAKSESSNHETKCYRICGLCAIRLFQHGVMRAASLREFVRCNLRKPSETMA